MSRAELAKENFLNGYACAQAVFLAFSDVTGLDRGTAMKLSLPFGAGLGRLRLTCGAVSGAVAVLGSVLAKPEPDAGNKAEVYAAVQEFCRRFERENKSLNCGELLRAAGLPAETQPSPEERSAEYYRKRPCPQLVYSAAKILEETLAGLSGGKIE